MPHLYNNLVPFYLNLKLFGSAGVIGNPLGFARSMGHGIRDFLSVPAKSIIKVKP